LSKPRARAVFGEKPVVIMSFDRYLRIGQVADPPVGWVVTGWAIFPICRLKCGSGKLQETIITS